MLIMMLTTSNCAAHEKLEGIDNFAFPVSPLLPSYWNQFEGSPAATSICDTDCFREQGVSGVNEIMFRCCFINPPR